MPWTPEQFRQRHNRKLTPAKAKKASSMANAMLKRGVPEGEAIATANKRVETISGAHAMTKADLIRRARGRK